MKKIVICLLCSLFVITGCGGFTDEEIKENTDYIEKSKYDSFVSTVNSYSKGVKKLVNEGKKLQFYDINKLYLVPVGDEKEKSCVSVEAGGKPSFGDKFNYFYIGVTYDGSNYHYYVMALDNMSYGINFVSIDDFDKYGSKLIANDSLSIAIYDKLIETYKNVNDKSALKVKGSTENNYYPGYDNVINLDTEKTSLITNYLIDDKPIKFDQKIHGIGEYVESKEKDKKIFAIEVIGAKTCN